MRIFDNFSKFRYFNSRFRKNRWSYQKNETGNEFQSSKSTRKCIWLSFGNVKFWQEFEEGGTIGKISLLQKLSKNCEKIQGCRSQHADLKNIARRWSRSSIFERISTKCEFLKIFKNFDISTVDSEQTVGVIKKTRLEVSSRARNLQENVFS